MILYISNILFSVTLSITELLNVVIKYCLYFWNSTCKVHQDYLSDSVYTELNAQNKSKFIKKKPCVLPKRFLLAHPLRLPLRLQDSLLLLAGTATWLGNPRLREVILAGASP